MRMIKKVELGKKAVCGGEHPTERTISNIALEFEHQEVEALSFKNSYEATYDKVYRDIAR